MPRPQIPLSGLILALTLPTTLPAATNLDRFQYLSPLPGSRLVSPGDNVIVRPGAPLAPGSVSAGVVTAEGSESGEHAGRVVLSTDGRTVVFVPDVPFALGERVTVRSTGLSTLHGEQVPAVEFEFEVATRLADHPLRRDSRLMPEQFPPALPSEPYPAPPALANGVLACDTLPPFYTPVSVVTSNDPDPAKYFLSPFNAAGKSNLTIVDERGQPVFYRRFPGQTRAHDFKRQQGLYTFWLEPADKYYAMDDSYAIVDSFAAGNGLPTDLHGMQLLPNGHALLQIYEGQFVDMSAVVPGGNPNAWVIGFTVQEIDAAKNVIFQWRGFDHYDYTDLASPPISLTDSIIDYAHGNAIELDDDGNLLLSIRHFNEITKVNRSTGDIIWRLGLNAVNNDFTFIGDTRGFSHQHDIRRVANGNITLYDNGNWLSPEYSRALEYELDEVGMTATLVWEYRNSPDSYGPFMGSVQRLANGNSVIGWGGVALPNITEVRPDDSEALELELPVATWTYRAFRFPWTSGRFSASADTLDFGAIDDTSSTSLPLTIHNIWSGTIDITCFTTTDDAFHVDDAVPVTIPAGDSITVDVHFSPQAPGAYSHKLYARSVTSNEIHAIDVYLQGSAIEVVSVPTPIAGAFKLFRAAPNPFRKSTRISFVLPREDLVRLDVFDVLGRRVRTLIDGVYPGGIHETEWTPNGIDSGLYFYRLQMGDQVELQRVVHMR